MKKLIKYKKSTFSYKSSLFLIIIITLGCIGVIFVYSKSHSDIKFNDVPLVAYKVKKPELVTPVVKQEIPKTVPIASNWPVQLTNSQASSLTVVVNKKHKLPQSYVPTLESIAKGGNLRPEATLAFNKLVADSDILGYGLKSISDYRSYQDQVSVYNGYVARDGQAQADTYSARPGHSEHQTGLAVDVGDGGGCSLQICFGQTAAGQWVAANAPNYGFIIRYPAGKQSITGYQYEPWHLRYVGVDLAKAVTASGKTLDEYFGVPAGDYL